MKNKQIQIYSNKVLKLNNVLIKEVDLRRNEGIEREVFLLENYFKNKGAKSTGPLIQYTKFELSESQEPKLLFFLLRQSNSFLHNIDKPYKMIPIVRVPNCMYARFIGEENKLKLAFDKINVVAYEEDIPLKGDSYTIFVDKQDGIITADIFMECEANG